MMHPVMPLSALVLLTFLLICGYRVQAGFDWGYNPILKKVYHVDLELRTRDEAQIFCGRQTPPRELVTIDLLPGDGDYEALDENYHTQYFDGQFWTAGRDMRSYSQFEWSPGSGVPVSGFGDVNDLVFFTNRTCLTFNSKAGARASHGLAMPCESTAKTICQHFNS